MNFNKNIRPLLPYNCWYKPIHTHDIPTRAAKWLFDHGSTTAKLKQLCKIFRLERHFEGYVANSTLGDELFSLTSVKLFWLREVVLYGDEKPWIYCRTLIPQNMATHKELALNSLGTTALGDRLFQLPQKPKRDLITLASLKPIKELEHIVNGSVNQLTYWWLRRSRLTVSQGQLLINEVFLPHSPLYLIK